MNNVIPAVTAILFVTNVTAFFMFGADKRRAQKGKWRIPERALLLACLCFGALGGLLGMEVFRHKTRHPKFTVTVPALLLLQIAVLAFAAGRFVF